MFVISAKRRADGPAIESLLDLAFGPGRTGKTAYRYRAGVMPVSGLELVARDAGAPDAAPLVGSIQYWPVTIGTGTSALLLGPLAVAPGRAGEGIGRALVNRSLDLAQGKGHCIVLLVGPMDYYGQFGFRPAAPHGIAMPDEAPERLLVAELLPGALQGVSGDIHSRRWVRRSMRQRSGFLGKRCAA